MRFSYYEHLSASERRVYRKSDSITDVELPRAIPLERAVTALTSMLAQGDRAGVARASQAIANVITRGLGVPGVRLRVLSARPKSSDGELYGLYTREEDGRSQIELWMRTAEHRRVVALRTYLRTLAHELCHHLDFVLFGLHDTYHTEGFFRRESSVYRRLCAALAPGVPAERSRANPARAKGGEREARAARDRGSAPPSKGRQLSLFE